MTAVIEAEKAKRRQAAIEQHRRAGARYRAENAERESARVKAWAELNKERVREASRRHYLANREAILEKAAQRAKDDPESRRVLLRNRRARMREAGGTHTAADVKRLYVAQKGLCAICRVSLKNGQHVDHIVPVARGGSNDALNLQLLCPSCNHSKGATDPIHYMQSRGFLL